MICVFISEILKRAKEIKAPSFDRVLYELYVNGQVPRSFQKSFLPQYI